MILFQGILLSYAYEIETSHKLSFYFVESTPPNLNRNEFDYMTCSGECIENKENHSSMTLDGSFKLTYNNRKEEDIFDR